MKLKEVRHIRRHELRVSVAGHGMPRHGKYRICGGPCPSAVTDTSQPNVSACWRRCEEVFVGHCTETHVWSIVSLLTRPEMVELVENLEANLGAISDRRPSTVNFTP